MTLIAHLRGHAGLMRGPSQAPALEEGMSQLLLAIAVLAGADRCHRRDRVDMVRSADGDRVDPVPLPVEHLAEVLVPLRLREGPETACGPLVINVAEGHDVGAQ